MGSKNWSLLQIIKLWPHASGVNIIIIISLQRPCLLFIFVLAVYFCSEGSLNERTSWAFVHLHCRRPDYIPDIMLSMPWSSLHKYLLYFLLFLPWNQDGSLNLSFLNTCLYVYEVVTWISCLMADCEKRCHHLRNWLMSPCNCWVQVLVLQFNFLFCKVFTIVYVACNLIFCVAPALLTVMDSDGCHFGWKNVAVLSFTQKFVL